MYPPAQGDDPSDRTAFTLAQQTWGNDKREQRPDILFYIQEVKIDSPQEGIPWEFGGRRVIDRNNHGMRYFSDCPVTISSEIEGFRLDAMQKLNPNIMWADILGRAPDKRIKRGKERKLQVQTAFSNKSSRFRHTAGVLSWASKDFACNAITLEFYRKIMGDDVINGNSTRRYGKDLSKAQVRKLEAQIRDEKFEGNAKENKSGKRKIGETQDSASTESIQPPGKRVRRGCRGSLHSRNSDSNLATPMSRSTPSYTSGGSLPPAYQEASFPECHRILYSSL